MDKFIDVSHVFINDINRYMATSCDLTKRKRKLFYILMFFIFPLSLNLPRFKKRRLL